MRLVLADECTQRNRQYHDSPTMPATLKLRTRDLLLQLLPIIQVPVKYFEVLDIVSEIWHVLSRKGFIWKAACR